MQERVAFGLGKVQLVLPDRYLPDVDLARSDIEVAAQQDIVLNIELLVKVTPQPLYPLDLGSKFIRPYTRAVRDINIDHANAVDRPADQPPRRALRLIRKAFLKADDGMLRNQGNAVICLFAVVGDVRVTGRVELTIGEFFIDALGRWLNRCPIRWLSTSVT